MVNKIISRKNSKIMYACLLKKESERVMRNEFLMEGRLALEMGLKKGLVKEIFTTKELDIKDDNIIVNLVDDKVMDKLSDERSPEGIVFIAKIPNFDDKKYQKVIYLDHIADPGNMGTIIRTALGLGIEAIYISPNSVSPFNNKALAASKGAIFELPIFNKDYDDVKELKTNGYQIIVTSLKGNVVSLDEVKVQKPYICVFGNESRGVDDILLKLSDISIKIPIEKIDSFNVAISAAIVMYEIR
jgi:TrmH family RNA methyltransferase